MGKYRCVVLNDPHRDPRDPVEKCLAGRLGEVWERGDGTYKAFERNLDGSEKIISFNSEDLQMWLIRLEVPLAPALQATYANALQDWV